MINYKDEHSVEFTDEQKDKIMRGLIDHIESKTEGSMSDYILDFCELNEYRVEEVAYLIKEHKTFSAILKQDCIYHGIFKNENKLKLFDEW